MFSCFHMKIRRLTFFSIDDPEEAEIREEDLIIQEKIKMHKQMVININSFDYEESATLKNTSFFKKSLDWICGIESISLNKNELVEEQKVDTSIDQTRFDSNVCDISAVLVMAFCGFCYAFFNKF